MRILSIEEYQDRINPWLNKNLSMAHSIPVSFPQFRSVIANEVFLFLLSIVILMVMYVVISLLFSLPGLSSSTNVIENLITMFEHSKTLILFSLFALVYLRSAYFIFSKLNHELSIKVVGFVATMSIFMIAESLPTIKAWWNGNPVSYPNSLESGLIVWGLVAYVLTGKLIRQFREAQSKKAIKAS